MFRASSPGRLIPEKEHLRAIAKTQSGWELQSDPFHLDGYHVQSGASNVLWDLLVQGLTLTQPSTFTQTASRTIKAMIGLPLRHWPRVTETEVTTSHSTQRSSKCDWLLISSKIGEVIAHERSPDWFEVKFTTDDPTETKRLISAIARAFGFVTGRRIEVRGYEEFARELQTRRLHLWDRSKSKNTLYPPLGIGINSLKNVENLLGRMIDFFLTKSGEKVAQHLELCWDTCDNWLETRLAIVGICVEGLLREADAAVPLDAETLRSDRRIVQSWRRKLERNLSGAFIRRLNGFLSRIADRSPSDVLRDWETSSFLGVCREDTKAWKELRNSATHARNVGEFQDDCSIQDALDKFGRVVNLMNRIVLHLAHYSGTYTDYAAVGWPDTAPFPPPTINSGPVE